MQLFKEVYSRIDKKQAADYKNYFQNCCVKSYVTQVTSMMKLYF